jgi:membrane protein
MQAWKLFKESVKGFIENENYLHAAALTFYSLLSLVPLLAISFALAQAIGLEDILRIYLLDRFSEYKDFIEKAISFSYSYLNQAKSGWFALSFALLYFWIVLTLFASLENAFNAIWKIPHGRSISSRLFHYFILILICPFFAVLSSVVSILASEGVQELSEKLTLFSPIILKLWSWVPFLASWVLFLLLYKFVPNTKILWRHAFFSSVLAGSAYQFSQWVFIHFQLGVAQYGAIFGSFAAFPLFLMWLQVSWIILLFGAEVASRLGKNSV